MSGLLLDLFLHKQTELTFGNAAVRAVKESGLFAQGILVVLLGFSIISWAIMFVKWLQISRIKRGNRKFLNLFLKHQASLSKVFENVRNINKSPLSKIFCEGYQEAKSLIDKGMAGKIPPEKLTPLINRQIERSINREVVEIEHLVLFLATTANACPLMGLLGTVWGVLGAFHSMGLAGSASLAVVAPGISEALITTVAGLAAAIPAVVGYNVSLAATNRQTMEMEDFSNQLVNHIEKIFINQYELSSKGQTPNVKYHGTPIQSTTTQVSRER